MALPMLDLVAGIFKPAVDLIDAMHTSDEEKLNAKAHLINAQASVISTALDYERSTLEARATIIATEAGSEHVVAATWRPITMLALVAMIGAYWFGLIDPSARLTEATINNMFLLVQVGLGGYVVGRSAEKVMKAAKK